MELIEYGDHPWFLACQFHPEYKSRPLAPHPLFREFVGAAYRHRTRLRANDSGSVESRHAYLDPHR